jgi:hypothetical protein
MLLPLAAKFNRQKNGAAAWHLYGRRGPCQLGVVDVEVDVEVNALDALTHAIERRLQPAATVVAVEVTVR